MKKIGLVTIGQAPRKDITDDMRSILGKNHDLIELGALDNLSENEISQLYPKVQSSTLITKLLNEKSVVIGEEEIRYLMQEKIDIFNQMKGIDEIIIICTGKFPEKFISKKPLYYAQEILREYIDKELQTKKILSIIPLKNQMDDFKKHWDSRLDMEVLNPYNSFLEPLNLNKNYDLIFLNCLGYDLVFKKKLVQRHSIEVITPREVLCQFISGPKIFKDDCKDSK